MIYRLEHRPLNNKGHSSFRPWKIIDGAGRLFRSFTTHQLAIAALDLLAAGKGHSRHDIYRQLGIYGAKGRHHRQSPGARGRAPADDSGQPLPQGGEARSPG